MFQVVRRFLAIERKLEHLHSDLVVLMEQGRQLMSKFSEYAAKQQGYNQRQGAAIDKLVESQAGITSDIKTLNDKIEALQNQPGESWTPEDQALLDEITTAGEALTTRAEGVAAALAALDAQTPPVIPPTEG